MTEKKKKKKEKKKKEKKKKEKERRKKKRFVDWKKVTKIEKPCTQGVTKGSAIWTLQRWI